MSQRSARFLGADRADWQALFAVALLVAMWLLLGGCSAGDQPMAPVADDVTDGLKGGGDVAAAVAPAALAITAPGFDRWVVTGTEEQHLIVPQCGQVVQFFWRAVDGEPVGDAPLFRHGWNVSDPNNLADPGWAGPLAGNLKACQTIPRVFYDGTNYLTIERWDCGRLLVRVVFEVWVAPVAPRERPQDAAPTPAP